MAGSSTSPLVSLLKIRSARPEPRAHGVQSRELQVQQLMYDRALSLVLVELDENGLTLLP